MALAGYDANTSMKMLPNVLNLAAAGGIDLAYASDMITDTQSALGLTLEETSVMVDQMAKASSKSNTSVQQLGEAMLTIGATARNVKGGTQELSTVLGVLADNGIKGTEGGTHLRNILLSLQDAAEDGKVAFGDYAVSVYDSDGNMRSLVDIVGDMQKGLNGMSQEAKDALVSGVFNKTDLASVNALLGTSSERFEQLAGDISQAQGAAQNMADTQLDNLSGDITLFQSALEGAKIAVSDGLTPTIREFVQFGSSGLSRLTQAFKENGLKGAVTVFSDLVGEGTRMILEKLPTLVDAGAQLLGALIDGIVGALPTVISALPMFLSAVLDLTQKVIAGIIQALPILISSIVGALPTLIPQLIAGFVSLTTMLMENLPAIIMPIVEAFPDIMIAFTDALIANLPLLIQGMIELFQKIREALPEILMKLWEGISYFFSNIWETWIGPALEVVGQFFSDIWDKVVEIFSIVGEWFDTNVIQPVVGFFRGLWETVSGFFVSLWQDISGIFIAVADWFNTNVIEPVAGFFRKLWEGIVSAYHTVIDPWIEIFKRAFLLLDEQVIQPVKKFFSDLWEKIKEIFRVASTWFKTNVSDPIKNLFSDVWTSVKGFFTKLWGDIKNVFSVASNWFNTKVIAPVKNLFSGIWDTIKNGAKGAWTGIKNVFSPVVNWFKDKFKAAWEGVKNVFSTGGKIFSGIKEGIEKVFKTVVNAIIRGINKVVAFPFNAINGFLDKLRNISILGVAPFSWIGSIGVPQIPELAEGGVLTSARLILAGEAGDEAIVPLERNTGWIRSVAEELAASDNDDLLHVVEELSEKLDRMQIVLDSGRIVGGISTRMDSALGGNGILQNRGVALA